MAPQPEAPRAGASSPTTRQTAHQQRAQTGEREPSGLRIDDSLQVGQARSETALAHARRLCVPGRAPSSRSQTVRDRPRYPAGRWPRTSAPVPLDSPLASRGVRPLPVDHERQGSENPRIDPGTDRAIQRIARRTDGGKSDWGMIARLAGQPRRTALAAFLRARRARLRPSDVGLPEDSALSRRRTPGLRREEVADLSGVGVTWYTWLEQGRDIQASAQVVDALARALVLNQDEHRHLRNLAGLTAPQRETPVDDVLPRLQRLVDAVTPNVASIYDPHFDYLVWNIPYVRIRHDPCKFPSDRRNLLWMMFTDSENRARAWLDGSRPRGPSSVNSEP